MELAHTRRGSGPALVVLQHYAGSELWEPVAAALLPEHEVWSVDLPGFGDSVLPPRMTLDPAAAAASFAAWLGSGGPARPHVVGVSYAGAVAVELARTGRVASATAISPLGFWTAAEAALTIASVGIIVGSARVGAPLAPRFLGNPLGRRAVFGLQLVADGSRVPEAAAIGAARALARSRLDPRHVRPLLRYRVKPFEPEVPLTIAWGDRDRLTPPFQARRAARLLPGARHVTLTGCGHLPTFDDPDQVVAAVLATTRAG